MIARSTDYVEYCRETAKHLRDVHDLALRGKNKQEITRHIQELILQEVDLRPEDDLIDIGCGDGTLLRLAERLGVRSATGLLATGEEVAVLERSSLRVQQGLTHELPLPDQSISVIICNSVLLVVPREKIPASLNEICRIARPAARIFIGEIPCVPGPRAEPQFSSTRETLSHLYHRHGARTCFGLLRRMVYWKLTGQPMIIRDGSAVSFYAAPADFIAMAETAGLELVRYWQHEYPRTRYNYLFRKP